MLGSRGFNAQLNDTKRRFTYFVPRDYAWDRLQIDYPSLHKKLFMRDFAYHVSTQKKTEKKVTFCNIYYVSETCRVQYE